ncbi:hypothetical protein CVT24_003007 [Panaeolus cyanescens]|uniref:Uncharacterized protein n=1 Tax=Panaeolus cyanescens TaxID=181874 RepID=A0A409VFU0_9AGAR|nr:hypothetical protein CVT24_003007 [Panaeolus cyanescens]
MPIPTALRVGKAFLILQPETRVAHSSRPNEPDQTPDSSELSLSPEETKSICDLVESDASDVGLFTPELAPSQVQIVASTGFTPLSPQNHAQRLLIGESLRDIRDSPDLRLDSTKYASPLLETKPIFSPSIVTHLPRPGSGFEEIWRSRDNVTAAVPSALSTTSSSSLTFNPPPTLRPTLTSSFSRYSGSHHGSIMSAPPHFLSDSSTLPPSSIPTLSRLSSRFNTVPPRSTIREFARPDNFDRRLYPGSQRQRVRLEINMGEVSSKSPPRAGTSTPRYSESVRSIDDVDQGSIASSLMDADLITPTQTVPVRGPSSPTTVSVSSPGSSASFNASNDAEAETRPTTANSDWQESSTPNQCTVNITACSDRGLGSPDSLFGSPTVDSPQDLSVLPAISPLVTTPTYEIPEAQKPLPDSPIDHSSPIVPKLSFPVESKSPPPTLPALEPPQFTISPVSSTLSPSPLKIEPTSIASPKSPIPRSHNPNPLHCRACLADSCDDITASMCGHIFCNRYETCFQSLSNTWLNTCLCF